jgi:hypothetical protein
MQVGKINFQCSGWESKIGKYTHLSLTTKNTLPQLVNAFGALALRSLPARCVSGVDKVPMLEVGLRSAGGQASRQRSKPERAETCGSAGLGRAALQPRGRARPLTVRARGRLQHSIELGASRPEGGRDRVLSCRSNSSGTTEPRKVRVSALAGDARWRKTTAPALMREQIASKPRHRVGVHCNGPLTQTHHGDGHPTSPSSLA